MMAIRPMKSFPGRTASFTRIVPLGKLPLARRFLEAYTFFVPLCASPDCLGGIGFRFSFSQLP